MNLFFARATRLLAVVATLVFVPAGRAQPEPKKSPRAAEINIECKLTDDSVVKLVLLDAQIDFVTPHGKLAIPVSDIRRVELGLRIPMEVAVLIKAAAADLGSSDARKRDEAVAALLKFREKAYPTLKEAAKGTDAEAAKRAEEVIEKLQALVPAGKLELADHDVIHTDLSKIAGRIVAPTLKARSFALGEVQLKLADVSSLTVKGFREVDEVVQTLPDPGSLTAYRLPEHIGKTFAFKVTGVAGGALWGTELYTLDSSLASAAVHMGILKVGQSGTVKVTIIGPTVGFVGSTQNGCTSSNYDSYPGAYRIHLKPQ